ncbi:hypothetical protein JXJ21_26425 [candidate division KSB1 bacterium]|nr:hypothetical protein [candidate division KSB1 bacterium]
MHPKLYYTLISMLILIIQSIATPVICQDIYGAWTLIPHKSTEIDLYGTLSVEIQKADSNIILIQKWGTGRSFSDTLNFSPDGSLHDIPIHDRVFQTNVFMGVSMAVGSDRKIKAHWIEPDRILKIEDTFDILASQGRREIRVLHTYQLSENEETLSYSITRSTRADEPATHYLLKRKGTREAYYMELENDWRIDGKLDEQAFLISLQGLANLDGPNLYFIYPDGWDFTYTPAVFDFYKNERFYSFRQLKSCQQALNTFQDKVKGYVVWDKAVRSSLIVAFTIAGVEQAIVVSESLLPLVEVAGLKMVADLRGTFAGQSDYQITEWAYDHYRDRCSKELIVWLGGHHGQLMLPGVADWGIYNKAFFCDLSTKASDSEEYLLAKRLLSELNPFSMVMGWHSYKKDKERDHVALTSSFGHRVKGLHTLPNTSFSSQVPLTPGFVFRNNHNLVPGKRYKPGKKVYITCVQTDGVGLGAWIKPGRGEIPYAWCLGLNDLWMAPAMLEFFYSQATKNDYFIGGTTPGYMYPKAIPAEMRPHLFGMAREMLEKLDLNITQTMDYSEGATVEGNTELTREVVDGFYKYLSDVQGFLNGYAPAFTFSVKNNIPVVSYDYYLSPTRTVDDAVADLHELAAINRVRPYFLAAHIRQYSDIRRVKSILDKLGPEFEVVPLDIFMKLAGLNPTFKERYLGR